MDQGGDQVTELAVSGPPSAYVQAWAHSNVWAGGKLTATYDLKGIHYELADPLGTKRVQANALGQVDETCTSLPFGNDVGNPIGANCTVVANSLSTGDDATEHHFTQKERDTESGNDYFFARYYSSAVGRFISPDWSTKTTPVPYAVFADPQSLNLYAYVRNNPITRVDLDGHTCKQGDWGCNAWNAAAQTWNTVHGIISPQTMSLPTPAAPGLPAGAVHLKYSKNAPRLSPKVERKLQKELGKPGVMEATIGYTTNGQHGPYSNHPKGLAADIESIDGTPMTNQALNTTPDAYKVISDAAQYANEQGAHEVYGPGGQTYKDGQPFTASTPERQRALVDLHATHMHVTVGGGDE
jgi:RHS repeat-associated protein